MKKTTRLLLLLLSAIMMLTAFTACFKKNENGGDATTDPATDGTTNSTEVETNKWGEEVLEHGIPEELSYDGAVINFLIPDVESYYREWTNDAENPSTLDQKVLFRNRDVQEDLDVVFQFTKRGAGEIGDVVSRDALNTRELDIISNCLWEGGDVNLTAYYKNLCDADMTYLNLDQPYWNQSTNEVMRVNDTQYSVTGDINLSMWDRTHVVFFNKTKLPDYVNMTEDAFYDMVANGGFTYDYFYNLVKDIKVDDEDGTFGNNQDFIGLSSIVHTEASDGLFYAWDLNLTQVDTVTDAHTIVTGTSRQKIVDAFDKLINLYESDGTYLQKNSAPGGASGDNTRLFATGHALFIIDIIAHSSADLAAKRDMADGFGIVPLPKYDSNQTEYYTGVNSYANAIYVMDTPNDSEMLSAVLELMAYRSYTEVRPYYIKSVLKARTLSEGASEMFDIIMKGVRFDFIDFFQAGGTDSFIGNLWRYPFQEAMGGKDSAPRFTREEALNKILEGIDEVLYDVRTA